MINTPDTSVNPFTFYLGTGRPHWIWHEDTKGPLFVSIRQLRRRKTRYPKGRVRFAVDSGGFTELRKFGGWKTTPEQYVAQVRRVARETQTLDWAAAQDYMCEDDALKVTGLSVAEHQRRTTQNYLRLVELAPEIRWAPIIQGQAPDDYLSHVRQYEDAGVPLTLLPVVGLGSVCRRQHTEEIAALVRELSQEGLMLHGFGMKLNGLARTHMHLKSSDSLAWSFWGRQLARKDPSLGHLQNSMRFAEEYRDKVTTMTRQEPSK